VKLIVYDMLNICTNNGDYLLGKQLSGATLYTSS